MEWALVSVEVLNERLCEVFVTSKGISREQELGSLLTSQETDWFFPGRLGLGG